MTTEKRQLIEAIRSVNVSATSKFLSGFDEAALKEYLDHLNDARARQARPTGKTPAGKTPAGRRVA